MHQLKQPRFSPAGPWYNWAETQEVVPSSSVTIRLSAADKARNVHESASRRSLRATCFAPNSVIARFNSWRKQAISLNGSSGLPARRTAESWVVASPEAFPIKASDHSPRNVGPLDSNERLNPGHHMEQLARDRPWRLTGSRANPTSLPIYVAAASQQALYQTKGFAPSAHGIF